MAQKATPHDHSSLNRHHIRKWAAEATQIDPEGNKTKVTVYCYGCTPCSIWNKQYLTKSGRDSAANTHSNT